MLLKYIQNLKKGEMLFIYAYFFNYWMNIFSKCFKYLDAME